MDLPLFIGDSQHIGTAVRRRRSRVRAHAHRREGNGRDAAERGVGCGPVAEYADGREVNWMGGYWSAELRQLKDACDL